MNRTRNSKRVRGYWVDLRRAEYILEREIERSFKKDPVGAEMLTRLVLEPIRRMLDILDGPISEGEETDFALNLAGLNNYNLDTFERKIKAILPPYTQLKAEQGIEVQLVERRRVIAQLVPPVEGRSA